ncbi:A/G-specific adenine glycosylase [Hydrogenimonas urashimensis]|uniref:A/G-specific adenine glycosylase n=1 Tax=Hydrogenimonas urashimensis TaxID=2740515 RepID=UPI0019160753|nr:A/G-specific adenine glycosylase [Hydrogenimonas urashimensis]
MNYSDIHAAIGKWYGIHGRHDLPWRQTDDPYLIYISEMMLQQTQVKTVLKRFFFPFIERFPTLQSIKEASVDDLLLAWQGLGYYRRARYIHQTAQVSAPRLPTDPAELVKLPGIGKSTAHAIAAFSTHLPVAVLDANVKRVLHRFFAEKERKEKRLWTLAEKLLDCENPYIYNQAMMDIGATVCLPKAPRCDLCPLASRCLGREKPLHYPQPARKKTRPLHHQAYLWIEKEGKILMRKREGDMLGGLWELPSVESPPPKSEKIAEIVHDYSHFRRIAEIYISADTEQIEGEWLDYGELENIAISSLERKIFKKLKQ